MVGVAEGKERERDKRGARHYSPRLDTTSGSARVSAVLLSVYG